MGGGKGGIICKKIHLQMDHSRAHQPRHHTTSQTGAPTIGVALGVADNAHYLLQAKLRPK